MATLLVLLYFYEFLYQNANSKLLSFDLCVHFSRFSSDTGNNNTHNRIPIIYMKWPNFSGSSSYFFFSLAQPLRISSKYKIGFRLCGSCRSMDKEYNSNVEKNCWTVLPKEIVTFPRDADTNNTDKNHSNHFEQKRTVEWNEAEIEKSVSTDETFATVTKNIARCWTVLMYVSWWVFFFK